MSEPYTGRFAPSPTGPLHFGSLVAALASYLDARQHQGKWLLRIEDLDPPRESITALSEIRFALEKYGLHWDEEIVYQSRRHDLYQHALDTLKKEGLLYPCTCSRKQVKGIYDRLCVHKDFASATSDYAIRVKTDSRNLSISDRVLGLRHWNLANDIGDFIIKRKDGLFAYQLAVVVDDADQQVNQIIRGTDILNSTPRQIFLQQLFGLKTPSYAHIPVITHADGSKLSKQTGAKGINTSKPLPTLIAALKVLGQEPPADDALHSPATCLTWAIHHWDMNKVPKVLELCPD